MKLFYFLLLTLVLLVMAGNTCIGCGTSHDTPRALNVHRKKCKILRKKMDTGLQKRKENAESISVVQKPELPTISASSNVFSALGDEHVACARKVFTIYSKMLISLQAMDVDDHAGPSNNNDHIQVEELEVSVECHSGILC
jgi:hypothetical protein